ncbi:MAG: hypothetical protein AABW64_01865 [Nanoarchaeota archaeon]
MNAAETEQYAWKYTCDRKHIKLYRDRESIGTLTVARDLEGIVQRGKVLSLDPTQVNAEEFFSKIQTVPGIDANDLAKLEQLQEGFILVSSPRHGESNRTLFFYMANPERRERIQQSMRKRHGQDRIVAYCQALREV